MAVTIDKEYLIAGLKEYFVSDEMVALVNKIKDGGFKLSKIVTGVAVVIEAIKCVEKLVADMGEVGLGGEKKKAVQTFLDESIDLPFYFEPLDGPVISIVIDAIVLYYNSKFGNKWLEVVKKYM